MTLSIDHFYILVGLLLAAVAIMNLVDRSNPRRVTTALFWGLYALLYLAGEALPLAAVGALMIGMALLAGFGGVKAGQPKALAPEARQASAARLGNRLFIPALLLPLVTVIGATLLKDVQLGGLPLLDPAHITIVSMGCGAVVAQGVREARRLVDAMSWAVVLPHILAVLGLLFSEAGVGKAVAHLTTTYIGLDSAFIAVAVYCLGMALFTIVMGNGFAAFPVMAGGVGIPVLVGVYGANPAVMAAIGMFSAYCGTLMTPMAANFNIVPAALLELPDKNAVIRAQIPSALPILVANIFLLYFLMNL
jgi:uncharacterized membrane protein